MDQNARLDVIAQWLQTQPLITVSDICERFGVSRDTARRDLVKLQEQGRITRARGGAAPAAVPDFRQRQDERAESKRGLAAAAASYIRDGATVFLDASTTVSYLAEFVKEKRLTVVTASVPIARSFAELEGTDVYTLGGRMNKRDLYASGSMVIAMLDYFRADVALLGACGVYRGEMTVQDAEDAMIKQKMIARSDEVLLLADRTKLGMRLPFSVGALEDVDVLLTDAPAEAVHQAKAGGAAPKHIHTVGL